VIGDDRESLSMVRTDQELVEEGGCVNDRDVVYTVECFDDF
jgi:hypothetical protein